MKKAWIVVVTVILFCCAEEIIPSSPETECEGNTPATVVDLTGLDGCGFVFELEDGTRLEPIQIFYCGTPPLPKEVRHDPLLNFEFVAGKKVMIDYTRMEGYTTICMAGQPVEITCISEALTAQEPIAEK